MFVSIFETLVNSSFFAGAMELAIFSLIIIAFFDVVLAAAVYPMWKAATGLSGLEGLKGYARYLSEV